MAAQDERPGDLGCRTARVARRQDVEQADVTELLCAYREALELAADPPPSRTMRVKALTQLLCWLRPTWGLHRFVVDHVRGRVDTLIRRYCLRLALGETDDNDREELDALKSFASSLPPPRPQWWALLPLFAVLLLSQVLVVLIGEFQEDKKVLSKVVGIVDLNPAHFNEAVDTLLHSDPAVNLDVMIIVTLAIYLVFRPVLPAFRLKRMILSLPDAVNPLQTRAPLAQRAQEIAVHKEEVALFQALRMPTPPESALDLRVKATLLAFWLSVAAYGAFVPPADLAGAAILLMLIGLRAWWLLGQRRHRNIASMHLIAHSSRSDEPPAGS